ncbi:hypothetical protein F183_A39830 [Bryobacterales bacterium F-183]|nr:hypothetical protein F183_A39830 [Bryobacterales bacterium F-183]
MADHYNSDYDAIQSVIQTYIDGSRQGDSSLMKAAFHPGASFFGYVGDHLAEGMDVLFDWIDGNGPCPNLDARLVCVDILNSVAMVRVEARNWSGKLAGTDGQTSDLFTLLRMPEGWKIVQKVFHWHAAA